MNGKVILTNLTYGNNVTYECDIGYKLEDGNNGRMCGEDGDWTGIQPTCKGLFPLFKLIRFFYNFI